MDEKVKKPWESKTVWVNTIVALASFFPPAQVWISANPEVFGVVVSLLNLALRSATGEPVSWKVIDISKKF